MELKEKIAIELMFSKNSSGEVLKKWRNCFGIKQKEIAREMDMTISVVSDYERNRRNPSISFARDWILSICKIRESQKEAIGRN